MRGHECSKCGKNRIIPDAGLLDSGDNSKGKLQAFVYSKPTALFLKGRVTVEMNASICCDCGHAEVYASGDLEKLWESYK